MKISWNSNYCRVIAPFALSALLIAPAPAQAFNEGDIIAATFNVNTLDSCQNYCLVDVCVYIELFDLGDLLSSGSPTHFVFTPKIDHYNPDLIVSVFNLTSGGGSLNPWDTARVFDNNLARPAGSAILQLLVNTSLGPGSATNGTSPNIHRQVISREASAVGHPFASLPAIVNGRDWPGLPEFGDALDGSALADSTIVAQDDLVGSGSTASDAVTDPANIPVANGDPIGRFANNTATNLRNNQTAVNTFAGLAGVTGGQAQAAFAAMNAIATVNNIADAVDEATHRINVITNAAERVREVLTGGNDDFSVGVPGFSIDVDKLLCPNDTISYFPYYLSQLDVIGWHFGIPEMFYPQALIPGWDEIGNFPWYTWGSLYPRVGSLGTKNTDQAGAVFAQRVANIVTQSNQPHIYIHAAGPVADSFQSHINGGTKWQMLAPRMEHTCQVFGTTMDYPPINRPPNVADTAEGNLRGNFSYALWRHYSCCSASADIYLGTLINGIGDSLLGAVAAVEVPAFCPAGLLAGLFPDQPNVPVDPSTLGG